MGVSQTALLRAAGSFLACLPQWANTHTPPPGLTHERVTRRAPIAGRERDHVKEGAARTLVQPLGNDSIAPSLFPSHNAILFPWSPGMRMLRGVLIQVRAN